MISFFILTLEIEGKWKNIVSLSPHTLKQSMNFTLGFLLLFFFVSSRFLFDLTHSDSTNPSEGTLRVWIQKISEHVKVGLQYTERLRQVLINRRRHLKKKMSTLKGGAPKQRFLSQLWTLLVEPQELEAADVHMTKLATKMKSLEKENGEMKKRVVCLSSVEGSW